MQTIYAFVTHLSDFDHGYLSAALGRRERCMNDDAPRHNGRRTCTVAAVTVTSTVLLQKAWS